MNHYKLLHAFVFLLAVSTPMHAATGDDIEHYGNAKIERANMPPLNTVFDVSYDDPKKLNILYDFIQSTRKVTRGKVVVVFHGPELRAFAKENHKKYQSIVEKMVRLARSGVALHMCSNAMKSAGYQPKDIYGFITLVPSGFADIAYHEYMGYQYINPTPLSPKDVRYIDQPQLRGK